MHTKLILLFTFIGLIVLIFGKEWNSTFVLRGGGGNVFFKCKSEFYSKINDMGYLAFYLWCNYDMKNSVYLFPPFEEEI